MSSPRSSVVPALILVLLLAATARDAAVRVRGRGSAGRRDRRAAAPPARRRRAPRRGRSPASRSPRRADAKDVRVVVSRVPFDPTGWTSLPTGRARGPWSRYDGAGPARRPELADPTDTPLWWAVVWTDAADGRAACRARSGSFTLVPRFANRVGADGALCAERARPAAPRERAATVAPRRPIELAAGYSLVPGEAPPDPP